MEMYFTVVQLMGEGLIEKINVMNLLKKSTFKKIRTLIWGV